LGISIKTESSAKLIPVSPLEARISTIPIAFATVDETEERETPFLGSERSFWSIALLSDDAVVFAGEGMDEYP